MRKKVNIYSKIKKKICRNLSKSEWVPNQLRVTFLRAAGANVGKDVYLAPCWRLICHFGEEHLLTIEDRASIVASILVSADPNNSRLTDYFPNVVKVGKVHIEHDVWCGINSIILPGVRIGKYSIVGAGSLVNKDVPPYTIVAGSPAKIIKQAQ